MNNVVKMVSVPSDVPETQGSTLQERRKQPIRQAVGLSLKAYLCELDGHDPSNLYDFVLCEVERPLLEIVLEHTDGNVTKAADILGLNRGTLRKKLKKYGLN
jgi:Fis family transcriptional regulator